MPYEDLTLQQRLLLASPRWVDPVAMYQWCLKAQRANVSVVSERKILRDDLSALHIEVGKGRFPDKELIDTMASEYRSAIASCYSFLSSRGVDKNTSITGEGAAVQTVRGLTSDQKQRWETALSSLISAILAESGVTTREEFEEEMPWSEPAQTRLRRVPAGQRPQVHPGLPDPEQGGGQTGGQ